MITPRSLVHVVSGMFLLATAACSGGSGKTPTTQPRGPDLAQFDVLSDAASSGALGAFAGPGDSIVLSTPANAAAPEGSRILAAEVSVSASGFAGFFIESGASGGSEVEDLTSLQPNGSLRFFIRSDVEVEIGIRSFNIAPGTERSRIGLRRLGYAALAGEWEEVAIPLDDFVDLEPRINFSEIEVVFAATFRDYVGQVQAIAQFDAIRWERPTVPPQGN